MIRALYRHQSGSIITDLSTDQLAKAVKDRHGRIWIDLQAPTDDEYRLVLEDLLHCHPLAVKSAMGRGHDPKLNDYGNYLFMVFHTLDLGDERMDIHTHEFDVYLDYTRLVTIHDDPLAVIDQLWSSDSHQKRGLAQGPSYLLYDILDRQVDGHLPLLANLEKRVDVLGDIIFQPDVTDESGILNELLTAKGSALRLHRVLMRQSELLYRLGSTEYAVVPPDAQRYFTNLYEYSLHLTGLVDSVRDLTGTTIDTHLALISNRTNDVMKMLTVVGSIFLPLSFLVGVYGMNFSNMPELNWPWAYGAIWALFIALIGGMLWWFRRQRWL
jgi:magnesium transporter